MGMNFPPLPVCPSPPYSGERGLNTSRLIRKRCVVPDDTKLYRASDGRMVGALEDFRTIAIAPAKPATAAGHWPPAARGWSGTLGLERPDNPDRWHTSGRPR